MGHGHRAIELAFLGTAAAVPTRDRALPAALVLMSGRRYLVDCGEGVQRQLLKCGMGWKVPDAILVTHAHLDHIIGLTGYLATLGRMGHDTPVPVYAPGGSGETVLSMLSGIGLDYMAEIRPSSGLLIDDSGGTVSCFPLTHGDVPCNGYRFTVGGGWHLSQEALERRGVPEGPLRRRLALGETVVLPGGRTLLPDDVRGDRRMAVSTAVAGDCASWEELAERTRGVTLLVGEATYLERDRGLARKNGHITAQELAAAARRAEAAWLVATHLSQRYAREEYVSELQQGFPGAVLAEDCLSVGLSPTGELLQ